MSYRLEGSYFENCSCEVACPCGASNLVLPATYDRCEVLLAFNVRSGEIDGTDVSGASVALFGDAPAQMADGGWRVGMIVDAAASEEQRAKLVSVFSGEQGGPPAMLGEFIGEVMGVEFAPIEYADDGRRHRVRIGEDVDVEVEDFAAAEEGQVMTLSGVAHPASSTLALGRATRSRMRLFGYDLALEGRNAHSAPFSWAA